MLKLNNPIWNTAKRRARLARVVAAVALQFETDVKRAILDSTPRGKTYRHGRITKPASKKTQAGLKKYAVGGKTRVIVGYGFHRASAVGQAPAVDTGRLLNSIRANRRAQLRYVVGVGARYGGPLDAPDGLNRPFFASTFKKNKRLYLAKVQAEMARQT